MKAWLTLVFYRKYKCLLASLFPKPEQFCSRNFRVFFVQPCRLSQSYYWGDRILPHHSTAWHFVCVLMLSLHDFGNTPLKDFWYFHHNNFLKFFFVLLLNRTISSSSYGRPAQSVSVLLANCSPGHSHDCYGFLPH